MNWHSPSRGRPCALALAICVPALVLAGCGAPSPERREVADGRSARLISLPAGAVDPDGPRGRLDGSAAQTEPLGLMHYQRWSERLAQGGDPEGEEGFASLAAMGFRTVISVDGAPPKLETAARHGLTYVHVPIGYDGIDRVQALQIISAVERSDGPVYVHCHHGRHRGPAAAAIARVALEGTDRETAIEGLRSSGCSPRYTGLYRAIAAFETPSELELASVPRELPSRVRPDGIKGVMTHIDHRWDLVAAAREAGWRAPARHPDIDPEHEVGMIENALRELAAMDEDLAAGEEFQRFVAEALKASQVLEAALDGSAWGEAGAAYERLQQSCEACHAAYRN
jgi:protein tyrosine phosphatase (PTP) superfamily phosphohydrolase (DUF442 family)